MSLSDPIADMLTRIRNAARVRRKHVNVRASKVCAGICEVLKGEGYIEDWKRIDDDKQGLIRVYLRYGPGGEQVVSDIQRVPRMFSLSPKGTILPSGRHQGGSGILSWMRKVPTGVRPYMPVPTV